MGNVIETTNQGGHKFYLSKNYGEEQLTELMQLCIKEDRPGLMESILKDVEATYSQYEHFMDKLNELKK